MPAGRQGGVDRARRDALGDGQGRRRSVRAGRHRRGRHARARPRARRGDRRHAGDRQQPPAAPALALRPGNTLASQLASSYQSAPTNIELASLVYLGLILLVITFVTNLVAQRIVHRFERAARGSEDDGTGVSASGDRPRAAPADREPASPRAARSLAAAARGRRARAPRRLGASSRGVHALNLDFFTKGPAVVRRDGRRHRAGVRRHAACSSRSRRRSRCRSACCSRSTSASSRRARIARADQALARRPERLPVDRDRHLRLRADRADEAPGPRHRPPPERVGRRVRALDHHAAARRADDDGGARARAEPPARGELRARRLEVAHRA